MANFWISPRVSIGCLEHVWWRCLLYCACHTKRIFSDPVQTCHTCARTWCGFDISTSKCAAPQRVRCLNSSTAKSAPDLHCFVHFDFGMCFALKSSALFSTTQLPKVLRQWGDFNILASTCASCQSRVLFCNKLWAWGVFNILTSKCASRHSGGQFLISHGSAPAALASLLFDPPEPQHIRKTWANAAFRRFSTFSHTLIFFLLALSLSRLPFPTTVAASLHMSEVWLLNFLRKYVLRWGRDRSEQTLGRLLGS